MCLIFDVFDIVSDFVIGIWERLKMSPIWLSLCFILLISCRY